jgi:hypothetical protein
MNQIHEPPFKGDLMIRNEDFSTMIENLAIAGEVKGNPDHVFTHDFRTFLGNGTIKNAPTIRLQVVEQYISRSVFLKTLGSSKPNSVNVLLEDIRAELATR